MNKNDSTSFIALEAILKNNMKTFHGQQVMTIEDIASLYEVLPAYLQQRINKNTTRFPSDFKISLNQEEQIKLKTAYKNVFTEAGILMAGGLLRNNKSVKIHIQFIDYFVHLCRENSDKLDFGNGETAPVFDVFKQMIKK